MIASPCIASRRRGDSGSPTTAALRPNRATSCTRSSRSTRPPPSTTRSSCAGRSTIARSGWQDSDRIPIRITGGREGGFRGVATKQNYVSGRLADHGGNPGWTGDRPPALHDRDGPAESRAHVHDRHLLTPRGRVATPQVYLYSPASHERRCTEPRRGFFGTDRWASRLPELSRQYREAHPFPHIQLADFLDPEVAATILREFPRPSDTSWIHYKHYNENKLGKSKREEFPPAIGR